MKLKYKRWHDWVDDVTIVGDEYSAKELIGKLIDLCQERKYSLASIPHMSALSNYFRFGGKFEKSDSYGKRVANSSRASNLWVRIK